MIELSKERINQILTEETVKTVELATLLRSIYSRYRHVFEEYAEDIEELNDEKVAELKKYHDETNTLVKYYYMDIPMDVCKYLEEFDNKTAALFGPEWRKFLYEGYDEFLENCDVDDEGDNAHMKALYRKEFLKSFYEDMDEVFRQGFGTESKTAQRMNSGLSELLYGKKDHS
jgi:hypothetical protein